MFFWQRHEVWMGDFEGCGRAENALAEAGIPSETKLFRRERMLAPGSTPRGSSNGMGNSPQNPGIYYLYVKRADLQRAKELLGMEDIR